MSQLGLYLIMAALLVVPQGIHSYSCPLNTPVPIHSLPTCHHHQASTSIQSQHSQIHTSIPSPICPTAPSPTVLPGTSWSLLPAALEKCLVTPALCHSYVSMAPLFPFNAAFPPKSIQCAKTAQMKDFSAKKNQAGLQMQRDANRSHSTSLLQTHPPLQLFPHSFTTPDFKWVLNTAEACHSFLKNLLSHSLE